MANTPGTNQHKQQAERKLLSEWLAFTYPQDRVQQQVRLGANLPEISFKELTYSELKYLGRWRRWADAIVFRPHELILIEASVPAHPGYISQLQLYRSLIPLTPELEQFKGLPVRMLYLVAIEDPLVTRLAREAGIEVQVYLPAWVEEYLTTKALRKRRPTKSGGL